MIGTLIAWLHCCPRITTDDRSVCTEEHLKASGHKDPKPWNGQEILERVVIGAEDEAEQLSGRELSRLVSEAYFNKAGLSTLS